MTSQLRAEHHSHRAMHLGGKKTQGKWMNYLQPTGEKLNLLERSPLGFHLQVLSRKTT